MNSVTYTVPNMSCKHCVHTIENELSDLQGLRLSMLNWKASVLS